MSSMLAELLTEVRELRKEQREAIDTIRSVDKRVERALIVSINTEHRMNEVERKQRKAFEECPGRFRLEEHLRDHEQSAASVEKREKIKFSKLQKMAIAFTMFTGLGSFIYLTIEKLGQIALDLFLPKP